MSLKDVRSRRSRNLGSGNRTVNDVCIKADDVCVSFVWFRHEGAVFEVMDPIPLQVLMLLLP